MTAVMPTIPLTSGCYDGWQEAAYIDSILQRLQILVEESARCRNKEIRSKSMDVGEYRVPIIGDTEQAKCRTELRLTVLFDVNLLKC